MFVPLSLSVSPCSPCKGLQPSAQSLHLGVLRLCPVSSFPKAHGMPRHHSGLGTLLYKNQVGEAFSTWNDDKGMVGAQPFCRVAFCWFQLFHIPRLCLFWTPW